MKVGDHVICHYSNKYCGTTKGEILSLPTSINSHYVILYFTYDSNGNRHEGWEGWFFEDKIELDKQYYRKLKLKKLNDN